MEDVKDGPILPLWSMYYDLVRRHLLSPDAVVGSMDQSDVYPTLDVATYLQVRLLPFCCEAAGYVFKPILCFHAREAIHLHDKGAEVTAFMEAGIQILLLCLLLCLLKTLFWWLFTVIEGISVHNMHVINNVRYYLTEVTDEKASILLWVFRSLLWII